MITAMRKLLISLCLVFSCVANAADDDVIRVGSKAFTENFILGEIIAQIAEETGVASAEIIGESAHWHRYDLPDELLGRAWRGRYRGQEQKWFAMRFRGRDGDIDVATKHPEFAAWRWAPMRALPDLVIPFKRPVYERVVAAFEHLVRK